MPYPNFHSCRLEDPKKYDTCRRGERIADKPDSVKGKKYYVIYCKKTGGPMEQQSFRYPKETWKASQAEAHCKHNKGSFEAAKPESKTSKLKVEMRSYNIELRLDNSDGKPKIRGHAAVFNELSLDLGGFKEKIKKGTFKNTILNSDIKALKNHDKNLILGRNKSGTLILEEDSTGLKMIIDPPDTTYANDLLISMERKDIDQCSFSFRTIVDEWDSKDKNNIIRTLKEVELRDVSIVTYPAFPQTSANVRSAQDVYNDHVNELQENELAEITDELRQERLSQLRKIDIEIKNKEIKKWKN